MTPANSPVIRLYCPNRKPISRPPTPMSPAGMSVNWPMCRYSSVMNDWQNRLTSALLLPFGSKSDPPLAPPIGSVVRAFLYTCSNARNFSSPRRTVGWNRRPPLKGPIALFICTRKPRLSWSSPASLTHGTRNMITRSGSAICSRILAAWYFGCRSITGAERAINVVDRLQELILTRILGPDLVEHPFDVAVHRTRLISAPSGGLTVRSARQAAGQQAALCCLHARTVALKRHEQRRQRPRKRRAGSPFSVGCPAAAPQRQGCPARGRPATAGQHRCLTRPARGQGRSCSSARPITIESQSSPFARR